SDTLAPRVVASAGLGGVSRLGRSPKRQRGKTGPPRWRFGLRPPGLPTNHTRCRVWKRRLALVQSGGESWGKVPGRNGRPPAIPGQLRCRGGGDRGRGVLPLAAQPAAGPPTPVHHPVRRGGR